MKKENPNLRKKTTLQRWSQAEYDRVQAAADAARMPLAQYVREVALGNLVRPSRGLPAKDRALVAEAIAALNTIGAPLMTMADETRLGDLPLALALAGSLQTAMTASHAVAEVLRRVQLAAEQAVSELGRP